MKKDDVLKRLADLEKLKNDPVALSAAVSELSKEVSETKGKGNGEPLTDKATIDTLIALGAGIYVVTDKNTVIRFPYQSNFRIYYKGNGKPKAKADAPAPASQPAKEGPKEAPKEAATGRKGKK
jgi:hypothetical protein